MTHDAFSDLSYCPICLTQGRIDQGTWLCSNGHWWPLTLDAWDEKTAVKEQDEPLTWDTNLPLF